MIKNNNSDNSRKKQQNLVSHKNIKYSPLDCN